MFGEVKVLQLGEVNYETLYELPEYLVWNYEDFDTEDESDNTQYDVCIVDRRITADETVYLRKHVRAYSLFVLSDIDQDANLATLMKSRAGSVIKRDELQRFLSREARNYYSKFYGEKFSMENFVVSRGFSGSVCYEGHRGVILSGDFGDEFTQIGFFRNNIPVFENQAIDFFLEYEKSNDVELQLEIDMLDRSDSYEIRERIIFDEEKLSSLDECMLDNHGGEVLAFISIKARGNGVLNLIALHDRWSRRGIGTFLPGAKRLVTKDREEVFIYFEPGDLKPPLNVYFSGYKTREGFEGYGILRNFGSPFVLVSDQRLKGGDFYIGSEEYEHKIYDEIENILNQLSFTSDDLVMSGISMGSTGAIYYGAMFEPHSIIAGKPVFNLGTVALKERIDRPGIFPTSLDVLKKNTLKPLPDAIDELNEKMWNKFDDANWGNTTFVVSYMLDDDYDVKAYSNMLEHVDSNHVKIYGRGLSGRHNDNTAGIVEWFVSEYKKIMERDYLRK
jgi:accessory secretory protein Asp2